MYTDIPLWLAIVFVVAGLVALTWSADRFVDGAGVFARALGISPMIVGMVVIGFGTSAPELCVSALSGATGHSNLSLGNAYGSCIFNIAFILGVTALIKPIRVKPSIVFAAVPVLLAITVFSCLLTKFGGGFSRVDGIWLLAVFLVLLPVYCWFDQVTSGKGNSSKNDEAKGRFGVMTIVWIVVGLAGLVLSSHFLVWGSVDIARALGVSELLIGLTVVAAGTSLPELASAIVSARRGEHEFVVGNIVGSNFFNTLAVVGVAGTISPFKDISPYIFTRDMAMLLSVTLLLGIFGCNWRHPMLKGRINGVEGVFWTLLFLGYLGLMLYQEVWCH